MKVRSSRLVLVSSLAVAPVAWGGQAPRYRVRDLSAEVGHTYGHANDINDAGQVVGRTASGVGIWNPVADGWVVTDLEASLPFCFVDNVHAINNAGLAVGSMYCINFGYAAILWGKDGIGSDIYPGIPSDINDQGQVVGNSYDARAWLWENGPVSWVDQEGWAWAINDRSEVVGNNGDGRAALWRRDARGEWQMTDLGTLGGASAIAFGLNEVGQIVGTSAVNSESSHAFLWQEGKMLDLGILPWFDSSTAYGMNNTGQVVGNAVTSDYSTRHGFLWQDGTMWDLNDVVVSGPALEVQRAVAINESAQIVGWGMTPSAELHAILLNPIAPGDVDLDGDVDDTDLQELLGSWGDCKSCDDCPTDVDGDCVVGITDLLALLGNWLP